MDNKDVYWMLELEIKDGMENDFRTLMEEMVSATKANETDTLNYEWSISADGKLCNIYERYAGSKAVMTHLGAFGKRFAGRFLEAFRPIRFVVYGSPNQEVKDALVGFNPVYMKSICGFSR